MEALEVNTSGKKGQGIWEECVVQGRPEGHDSQRRRGLGSNRGSSTGSGDTLPHQPTRAHDAANDDPSAKSDAGSAARDETIRAMSEHCRQFLAVCHEETQGYILREGNHDSDNGKHHHHHQTNWVADEMWKYF